MKNHVRSVSTAAAVMLLICLSGCYKDLLKVTLNADGSGSVSQTVTFSERFVVATADGEGPAFKTLPMAEDALRAKIGSALEITNLTFRRRATIT